jgi:hypothetical protein
MTPGSEADRFTAGKDGVVLSIALRRAPSSLDYLLERRDGALAAGLGLSASGEPGPGFITEPGRCRLMHSKYWREAVPGFEEHGTFLSNRALGVSVKRTSTRRRP